MFAARAGFMTGKKAASLKGSVSFSVASNLNTTTSSAFTFGTGDFTIECWYYANAFGGNDYLFDLGANGTRVQLYGNQAYFIPASGSYPIGGAGIGFTTNTWNHLLMNRVNGTVYGFINGVSVGNVSNTSNLADTGCRINGYGGGNGNGLNGYISNFRILKGVSLYNNTFTPPTAALTSITGTSILACQDPGVIKDNGPNAFSLTANGTPTASSLSPFA